MTSEIHSPPAHVSFFQTLTPMRGHNPAEHLLVPCCCLATADRKTAFSCLAKRGARRLIVFNTRRRWLPRGPECLRDKRPAKRFITLGALAAPSCLFHLENDSVPVGCCRLNCDLCRRVLEAFGGMVAREATKSCAGERDSGPADVAGLRHRVDVQVENGR